MGKFMGKTHEPTAVMASSREEDQKYGEQAIHKKSGNESHIITARLLIKYNIPSECLIRIVNERICQHYSKQRHKQSEKHGGNHTLDFSKYSSHAANVRIYFKLSL